MTKLTQQMTLVSLDKPSQGSPNATPPQTNNFVSNNPQQYENGTFYNKRFIAPRFQQRFPRPRYFNPQRNYYQPRRSPRYQDNWENNRSRTPDRYNNRSRTPDRYNNRNRTPERESRNHTPERYYTRSPRTTTS